MAQPDNPQNNDVAEQNGTPSYVEKLRAFRPPVAVVVAGAGARGAYEAGALSVLLPALEEAGHRPTMFFGTSAGSINATLFASLAHMDAQSAAKEAIERWSTITKQQVMRPLWQSLPLVALNYVASLFGTSLLRLPAGLSGALNYGASLLRPPRNLSALCDTSPLRDTLTSGELINWNQLRQNIEHHAGNLQTVAVVATEYTDGASSRSTVFYTTSSDLQPPPDIPQGLDYVPVRDGLKGEHVLASSAIPVVFPPVKLDDGSDQRWYIDGGVRLNAPLKPAVTFGANTIVAIATDPQRSIQPPLVSASPQGPKMQDTVDQVTHGFMSDRMIEDLQNLQQLNTIVQSAAQIHPDLVLKTGSSRPVRSIDVLFCGPQSVVDIGNAAQTSLSAISQTEGLNVDLRLLYWLLGSSANTRPDLMSYLLFEPAFMKAAILLGQQHANAALANL